MASSIAVLSITVGGFLCAFPLLPRDAAIRSNTDSSGILQDSAVVLREQERPAERLDSPQTKPSESDRNAPGPVYQLGGDVTTPRPIYKVEPQYSEEARHAGLQGIVVLQIIIDEKGVPSDIKLRRRLGLGLDEKAVEALTKWRFKPGTKNGRPVAVRATVEINFRLLKDINLLLCQADQGDLKAQFELALAFELGRGVPQDYGVAYKWYREAARRGLPGAQNNLAGMYERGNGIAQDYSQAAKWYRKAADGGNIEAQSNLGQMYEMGRGVAQDHGRALKWYRKAAEHGYARAQFNLGRLYSAGRAVPQDHRQALGYCLKAAEQGFPAAQYAVALMLVEGQGAPKDRISALMWLELAEQGTDAATSKMAAAAAETLTNSMTREETAEARRLMSGWHPKKNP